MKESEGKKEGKTTVSQCSSMVVSFSLAFFLESEPGGPGGPGELSIEFFIHLCSSMMNHHWSSLLAPTGALYVIRDGLFNRPK